jgi:hypothetical protein
MVNGSMYADSSPFQDAEHSYMHAMRSSSQQSINDAMTDMMNFVSDQLDLANEWKDQGRMDMYYFELGVGMHPLMDMWSPSHIGFQVWDPDDIIGAIGHFFGEAFTSEGVDQAKQSILNYYGTAIVK